MKVEASFNYMKLEEIRTTIIRWWQMHYLKLESIVCCMTLTIHWESFTIKVLALIRVMTLGGAFGLVLCFMQRRISCLHCWKIKKIIYFSLELWLTTKSINYQMWMRNRELLEEFNLPTIGTSYMKIDRSEQTINQV